MGRFLQTHVRWWGWGAPIRMKMIKYVHKGGHVENFPNEGRRESVRLKWLLFPFIHSYSPTADTGVSIVIVTIQFFSLAPPRRAQNSIDQEVTKKSAKFQCKFPFTVPKVPGREKFGVFLLKNFWNFIPGAFHQKILTTVRSRRRWSPLVHVWMVTS